MYYSQKAFWLFIYNVGRNIPVPIDTKPVPLEMRAETRGLDATCVLLFYGFNQNYDVQMTLANLPQYEGSIQSGPLPSTCCMRTSKAHTVGLRDAAVKLSVAHVHKYLG
jgi:hypothetical protein